MSWITVIGSMIASACLTLAVLHLLVWFRDWRSWASLCFCVLAAGVIGVSAGELAAMYARTPEGYGSAIRWEHFAYGFVLVGSLGFVHFYFGTGNRWLLGAALGARLLALVANFSTGLNLHISAIHSLQQVNFLGESVAILGEWTPNPWVRLGQIAALAQFVYVVDASLRLWRTGPRDARRRAAIVGAPLAFFIIFSSAQAGLVMGGVLRMPVVVSIPFLAVLLSMSYELSRDVLRAAQLSVALRESEERMTMAAEAAGFGVWVWNVASNRVWGSEQWLRHFGFAPKAEVTFEQVIQRIHPEDRSGVEIGVRRAQADRSNYAVEYRVTGSDGVRRWIAARGRMCPEVRGKPARMMGASIDITEQKLTEQVLLEESERLYQSEKSLREATESLRQAAEAAEFGAYRVDLVTGEAYYSPEFLALFGLPAGVTLELDSDRLPRALHPDDKAVFLARMTAANDPRGSGIFDVEYRIRRPDGAVRWLRVRGRTTFSGPGPDRRPLRANGIILDITERKQAEMEIQRNRAEINHLSRVAMLGELSGSIAHELNQPLTAILSNAQAAQRFLAGPQPDLDEIRDILKDIVADDQRAGEVIRRLRLLLKKGETHHQPLDLNEVVQEVVKLIRSDLLNHNITLQTEFAPDLPAVKGDRVQLQQVMLNLIVNAIEAMSPIPPAQKRLMVCTECLGEAGVRVAVSDQGAGLPPAVLSNLFEPFFTTKPTGMGLGLKVCRTIMAAHDGTIEGRNNEGRGATFCITLPSEKQGRP